jgi:hypothetical protein
MKTSTITTVLSFAVIAAVLTGCSATNSNDLVPTSKPVASAPATTDAPAPAAEAKTGDVVDAAEAEAIKKAGAGQRAYPMADGTFVVVTKTEPLPAAVQADVEAKASAAIATVPDFSADMNGSHTAIDTAVIAAARTGKRAVVAIHALTISDENSDTPTLTWFIVGGPGKGEHFTDKSEVQSVIDSWLAEQASPSEFAVFYAG